MAQIQIRWDSQIMDKSIWGAQIKDWDIGLAKLTEWNDLVKKSQNLWDLADVAASRDNLWLWDAALRNIGTSEWNVVALDSNGKLPDSVVPAVSITDIYSVDTIEDRDALDVQSWDVAIVADNGNWKRETFIYDGSEWKSMASTSDVLSVAGKTGDVELEIADITNLQSSLDDKLDDTQLSANTSLWSDDTLIPTQNAVKTYVDNKVSEAATRKYWEELEVTDGSWELWDTSETPVEGTIVVTVNWNREYDFSVSWKTITMWFELQNNAIFKDRVFVDYNY